MRTCVFFLLVILVESVSVSAHADQSEVDVRVLNERLNNLESQAVQRRGRDQKLIDLLNRQDDRVAEQALNALKTKRPRDVTVPLLQQKLERSRRPIGRFVPR
ncbi:MAG: hypothetical protein ACR2QH_13675 [Geminicoccaceae bacterium]